jgi:hypothetical protein
MEEKKKEAMNIPNAPIFEYLANKTLIESEKGLYTQFHERVSFRLEAARYFLNKLKELEKIAGSFVGPGIKRDDVEFNLDAFLYEIVGSFDPLLQEINMTLKLGLNIKVVTMNTVITKLPATSKIKKTLGELDRNTDGWFWKLREYRNHSTHRKIIGFYLIKIMGGEENKVFLHKDPLNPEKGRADEEVMSYCTNSIIKIEKSINEIYKLTINELNNNKPPIEGVSS